MVRIFPSLGYHCFVLLPYHRCITQSTIFSLNFSKKYRLPINIDIFYIGSRYFYFILFFSLYNLILRNKYREGIGSFELFSFRYRNVFIRNNVLNLSACFNHSILHQNAVLYFCSLGYLDTTEQKCCFRFRLRSHSRLLPSRFSLLIR